MCLFKEVVWDAIDFFLHLVYCCLIGFGSLGLTV